MSLRQQITIPATLYCGFQQRTGEDDVPLGFVVPDGDDDAAKKRKSTVDDWAKRGNTYFDYTTRQYITRQGLAAVSFPNELLTGFKVSRSIKRSGWHGTNTVIRVEDPRGFELEISVDNFIQIMNGNLVDDGEILCRCIWGRVGQKNILLTENSEPYREAIVNTDRRNTEVAVADLKLGQKYLLKVGFTGVYLGQQHVLAQDSDYYHKSGQMRGPSGQTHYVRIPSTTYAFESKKAHFFYDEENNKLMRVTNPKVSRLLDATTITEAEAEEKLNAIILERSAEVVDGNAKRVYHGISSWRGNTLGKRPRKPVTRLTKTTEEDFLKLPGNPMCILEHNGILYRVQKGLLTATVHTIAGQQVHDPELVTADMIERKDLDEGRIVCVFEEVLKTTYARPHYEYDVAVRVFPRKEATYYTLEMEYKSVTTNITRVAHL